MITARMTKKLGWIPDLPDLRDHEFISKIKLVEVPERRDLRHDVILPVLDQGDLGSCVAHAVTSLNHFVQIKQGIISPYLSSRLFNYFGAREYLGTINIDSGATIRDGIKVIARYGAPPESLWLYQVSRYKERPSDNVYIEAEKYQAIDYQRIDQTLYGLTSCIAEGFPFVFGFSAYENFLSDYVYITGDLRLPQPHEQLIGGHAVLAISYNKKQKKFLCQNSWGNFGYLGRGYFTIPFDYILNEKLATDFWTIRKVE